MNGAPNYREAVTCGNCKYWDSDYLSYDGTGECEKYKIDNEGHHVCDDFEAYEPVKSTATFACDTGIVSGQHEKSDKR